MRGISHDRSCMLMEEQGDVTGPELQALRGEMMLWQVV